MSTEYESIGLGKLVTFCPKLLKSRYVEYMCPRHNIVLTDKGCAKCQRALVEWKAEPFPLTQREPR